MNYHVALRALLTYNASPLPWIDAPGYVPLFVPGCSNCKIAAVLREMKPPFPGAACPSENDHSFLDYKLGSIRETALRVRPAQIAIGTSENAPG